MSLIEIENEEGVFTLINELCKRTASKFATQSKEPQTRIVANMRSHAFEIILKKSRKEINTSKGEPIVELLSYYLVSHRNVKNVAEYKKSVELKKMISKIRQTQFGENKDIVYNVLKLLVGLSDTVKEDYAPQLFQSPFSFGVLDEMLPKPRRELFGSPQPYSYYPAHVFQLPYSIKQEANDKHSPTYSVYTVDSFDSKSFLPDLSYGDRVELRTFQSPISSPSFISTPPYSRSCLRFPRLMSPRDLQIPVAVASNTNIKSCQSSTDGEMEEVFRANTKGDKESVDIWELATTFDKNVPIDIWELASKMAPIHERQLIAMSSREMVLWKSIYGNSLRELCVISEKQFIRNIMYLIIGIETNTFSFCKQSNCFYMKENLVLEGVSREHIKGYVSDLLLVGTYYRRLYKFAFNQTLDEHFHNNGLIYEASREVIRRYLLEFRLKATKIYEDYSKACKEDSDCMPTLLQILFHMEPLKYEIETIASIYKLIHRDSQASIPLGAELMSYLFSEISMVTHRNTARTMYNSLFSICRVYFKFIERFIFEGELDDRFNEFFIRKDSAHVNTRSKRYWDKGFYITQSEAVPEFLTPLANLILLCGKSLRLLKHCNPSDPLVVLISSAHPSVSCCSSFGALSAARAALDVYRTRCLFVSGEPVTFQHILLRIEQERKACTEMASLKQAETMEKIVAERKRLAQLIVAEKQHSLRVLEQAMAEAQAARDQSRRRERRLSELQRRANSAREEVDAKMKDYEKNKMMEYYSKLNEEVEKSKMHTEWKIKRLQLDETRMQLLSTEERNLKREKLELEHKKNEEVMAMSIQSTCSTRSEDNDGEEKESQDTGQIKNAPSNLITSESDKTESKSSADMFMALCNAAKSIFGSKSDDVVDNKKDLDSQGNVVPVDTENNPSQKYSQSSDVIGADLNVAYDNQEFMKVREEALKNKHKVMAHEFGQLDKDNNPKHKTISDIDEDNNYENKVLCSEFSSGPGHHYTPFDTMTQAQKEAHINKLKILGVEYNLPIKVTPKNDPANVAQEEALHNKEKILGSECAKWGLSAPIEAPLRNDPANVAQEEALRNRDKMLASDSSKYDSLTDKTSTKDPANVAQEEALRNRDKILGSHTVDPNFAPIDNSSKKDPANFAQEEALRNKDKMLWSNVRINTTSPKREALKRTGLTLNLKTYAELNTADASKTTLGTGVVTPGQFLSELDLETPTTADVPLDGAMTSDVFTPQSETNKLETADAKGDKRFLTSEGFDFSLLVDEHIDADIIDIKDTPESSPSKNTSLAKDKQSLINYFEDTYNFDDFDPFGVKELKNFSKDYFSRKMDVQSSSSVYTHPAQIMEEVKKKPYHNMFSRLGPDDEDEQIDCDDNIATLTACLQRSVMLPLTYQLELVNNSIVTYFLVNLDMYEHLRSLKDYFFLMDGEFSNSICQNLFTRLGKTLNPHELLNFATLQNILDKALGSSISHVQKFSENLSFAISESPLSFQHSSPDVLASLSLAYAVRWPLNVILSQEALLRYSRVFHFLLKMRRMLWVLGEDFQSLKLSAKLSKEHSRKLMKSPQYISIQIYRHIMASMVRALDNYIVTTCILSSWKEFESDLKKARTLDDLYDCHVVYVKKVLFRCLLNNRSTPVMKLLNDIFTVILKFSRVLKHGEWQQEEPNGSFKHTNFIQLQELFHLFEKLAKYLHKVITKLMECGYQRHLAELLTMVNLNGFYDLDTSRSRASTAQSP